MSKGSIVQAASLQELQEKSIEMILGWMKEACEKRGVCTLGLSGGSAARTLYAALGAREDLPWDNVKVFLVDERYVPADHEESNQKLVWETLLRTHVPPAEHLCFPPTSLPIDDCVQEYEKDLAILLNGKSPDIVILGMGEDGHTASLFPGDETSIKEKQASVLHTTTDHFAIHDRITISLSLLSTTNHRIFLLVGGKKKAVFDDMRKAAKDIVRWPTKALDDEKTVWIFG
jgi:6-phosphogluconolactonase